MSNTIVWTDIPVLDLERAIRFYSAVFGKDLQQQEFGGFAMGLLPHAQEGASGCLAQLDDNSPAQTGPLIYLNVSGRHAEAESAVAPNGGSVIQPRHQIGPYGFRSIVLDSEGNRIALHSEAS